jgi:glycosyl transferase family 25
MICEDDCSFLLDRDRIDMIIEAFYADDRLDVLCLAYKALNGFSISRDLAVTSDTQTMSCYIIRQRVRNDLCRIAAKSVDLLRQGVREDRAAIDRVWKDFQKSVFFAIPNERASSQITSFSDIKGKVVTYGV